MSILAVLKSLFQCQPKGSVVTTGFLAKLQETCELSTLGLSELKALEALERVLAQTRDASYLPFAAAAFLLDERGLRKAAAAGLLFAQETWFTAARSQDTNSHWRPKRHPKISPNVLRTLLAAEHVRRFWLVASDTDKQRQNALGMLDAIVQDWAANASPVPNALGSLCNELKQTAAAKASPPPAQPKWLISISIDVAGSTEAKTRQQELQIDENLRQGFLRAFYAEFLKKELEFYDLLTSSHDGFAPLPLTKIFYVKGIGDEVWLLIEPSVAGEYHLNHIFVKLVNAAMVLASKPISLPEVSDLPLKIFIDKVDGAYEISEQRAQTVADWLRSAMQDGRLEDTHFAETANRLGAGTGTVTAGTWRSRYRTDYIGHDIDRLFRAAKAAKPLIVTIGQNLMHAVDSTMKQLPQNQNVQHSVMACIDPSNPNAQRSITFDVRSERRPAKDMKGINYDYDVYHIHDQMVLRAQFTHATQVLTEWDTRNGTEPQFVTGMKELQQFFGYPVVSSSNEDYD